MQRWMLWAGLGIVGLVLLTGGGLYGYREYLRSKPAPIWVPIALRADISMAEQKNLARQIEERLRTDALLRRVVADVGLREKFNQPDEEAAVRELERRLFVEVGTADTPSGLVPSVNVGVRGTGREKKVLGETTTYIIKDVWRMLGIDPETGKPLDPANAPPQDGASGDLF